MCAQSLRRKGHSERGLRDGWSRRQERHFRRISTRILTNLGSLLYTGRNKKHMVMDKMHSRAYLPCVFVKLSPLNINRTPQARFDSELYIVYCACKYTVLNPCSYVYLGPRAQCVCAVLFNVIHDSLFDLGSRASPPKGNNTALRMALIFGT